MYESGDLPEINTKIERDVVNNVETVLIMAIFYANCLSILVP